MDCAAVQAEQNANLAGACLGIRLSKPVGNDDADSYRLEPERVQSTGLVETRQLLCTRALFCASRMFGLYRVGNHERESTWSSSVNSSRIN